MPEHLPLSDSGVVPLAKRTVECTGVKIRMEFYPAKGAEPCFCPVCGQPLPNLDEGGPLQ